MSGRFVPSIVTAILLVAGCAPEMQELTQVCPGKASVAEAMSVLRSNSQNMAPLWAKGQCLLQYYVDQKKHKENLAVTVLVRPPAEIYLQGDATLVPKAIVLGSNEREFWLSIKPKEISAYWWGEWSEQDSPDGLVINPKTLLEALGIVELDAEESWSLSNEGAFDILTKRERGIVARRIHIYSCDYLVRKIEYFDSKGQAAASTKLARYKEVSEGFFAPASIEITTHARDNIEDSLSITLNLKSMKPPKITDERQDILFRRPPPRGFKSLYRVINGRWIEQPQ